jgi:hypothetical protein
MCATLEGLILQIYFAGKSNGWEPGAQCGPRRLPPLPAADHETLWDSLEYRVDFT